MQQFNLNISAPRGPLVLYASQGDSLSRFFEVTVTDNGAAYEPPAGAIYTVRFGAPGMPAGWYDTITEVGGGTHPAVVVSGNTYTVELAEQAVSVPGTNAVVLIVSDATGYTLASWAFELQVAAVPGYDAPEATVYYNALSEQVAQTLTNAQAAAASASAAAASAAQAAESAASINPGSFATSAQGEKADTAVQTVNGSSGPAATVTTQNLEYQVGDTITSANAEFDPNVDIGGTWTSQTMRVQDVPSTKIQLGNGVTSAAPEMCTFRVIGGICIATFYGLSCTGASNLTVNLPAPVSTIYDSSPKGQLLLMQPDTLRSGGSLASESFTFIYPTAGYQTLTIWTKTA